MLKVSNTVNLKVIKQIQQTRIPLTKLISYLNRLKKAFYAGDGEPLGLTASGNWISKYQQVQRWVRQIH